MAWPNWAEYLVGTRCPASLPLHCKGLRINSGPRIDAQLRVYFADISVVLGLCGAGKARLMPLN
jgi:hypothetical protein